MDIRAVVLVLIVFSAAGVGVGTAILMAMAERRSLEERCQRCYDGQEARWMQYVDKIYRLYAELEVAVGVKDAKAHELRREIMNLFDETQIVIKMINHHAK